MSGQQVSITDAKARFADLVRLAEAGQTVHITRRGKPVALLMSEARFDQLQTPCGGWVAFSKAWRKGKAREGLPLVGADRTPSQIEKVSAKSE